MRLRAGLCILLFLSVACGTEDLRLPDVDLDLYVGVATTDVELGRAFPLEVVRVWRKDLVPAPWDDRVLAPLDLRLEDVRRREDGRHVEERRRYRAYAFTLGDVRVPAPATAAREPGAEREHTAEARELRLRVRSALDASASNAPELPGAPLPEPFPWPPWAFAAAALLAALAWRGTRSRPRFPSADAHLVAAPPSTPAYMHALERLGAIRGRTRADPVADVVDGCDVLRDFVGTHSRVAAREMTTQELAAIVDLDADLVDMLRVADRIKFAALVPSLAERGAWFDRAEAFVRREAHDAQVDAR